MENWNHNPIVFFFFPIFFMHAQVLDNNDKLWVEISTVIGGPCSEVFAFMWQVGSREYLKNGEQVRRETIGNKQVWSHSTNPHPNLTPTSPTLHVGTKKNPQSSPRSLLPPWPLLPSVPNPRIPQARADELLPRDKEPAGLVREGRQVQQAPGR